MAKDQQDPVSSNEYILRRIPRNWFNRDLREPVQRIAFEPNKNDVNGISVFREDFVTPLELAEKGRRGPSEYYVVRLLAQDVFALGLEIQPYPQDGQPPGHALIPQLSFPIGTTNKLSSKEIQHALAKLAGRSVAYEPPQ